MHSPRLSIGLPVYDGEEYLAQTLESLLGQTFGDFELLISDNASTDGTEEIARRYMAEDSRVRYWRLTVNVGAAPNHDLVFRRSRGEFFKWVGADDLFARDLLERCVAVLDERPDAVLSHAWTAAVDSEGKLIQALEYPLATDSMSAPARFRSLLLGGDDMPGAIRADDFYGLIRADALRQLKPHDSYYHADQTFMAQLALLGPFVQVPDWLYFRRHHAGRALQANPTARSWCANLDPRRRDERRNPGALLYAEYAWGYVDAIRRAPLTNLDRRECYTHLAEWAARRAAARLNRHEGEGHLPVPTPSADQTARLSRTLSTVAGAR